MGALFATVVFAAGGLQGAGSFVPRLMPVLVLGAVPLVALVVMWLEGSDDHTFVEHLVFTVHLQAFGFFVLAGLMLEAALKGAGAEGVELAEGPFWTFYYFVLLAWFVVYLVASFRRAYGDSWGRAVFNSVVLVLAWLILVPVTSGLIGGAVTGLRPVLGL